MIRVLAIVFMGLTLAACEREARRFDVQAKNQTPTEEASRQSSNQPALPLQGKVRAALRDKSPYEENAYAVNQGKRLYRWYNCNGCHGMGGGGIGPALMDGKWKYGGDPASIFNTIMQGRPEGHALVRGPHPGRRGVADRRLCALDERAAAQGRRAQPRRHDLSRQSGERAMTPMMGFFLRFMVAVALMLVLWSIADYSMAATPVDTVHNALQPFGPQGAHFVDLWRVFLGACTFVFVAILVAVFLTLRRTPRADAATLPDLTMVNRPEPVLRRHVTRAVVVSGLALIALIIAQRLHRSRDGAAFTRGRRARRSHRSPVVVVGAIPDGAEPSDIFVTANEMHIPVGRPVVIKLNADDVIHSFWVPNLAGKKDLIPGRTATAHAPRRRARRVPRAMRGVLRAPARADGIRRGRRTAAQFAAWAAAQRQPAPEPTDAQAQRGKQVFQASGCAMCHAIPGRLRGRAARAGPDARRRPPDARRPARSRTRARKWPAGSAIRSVSSPAPRCPRRRCRNEDLEPSSPIWED